MTQGTERPGTSPRVRVLFCGAAGRMGRTLVPLLGDRPGIELVAAIDREDDLAPTIERSRAEVVVDFTNAEAAYHNALTTLRAGAHGIVGTTGLAKSRLEELARVATKAQRGLLIAPNLSLGMVLLQRAARQLVEHLPRAEILESHHEGKRDAPSGTAFHTAEMLHAAGAAGRVDPEPSHARGLEVGNVRVHSLRLPGIHARQEVRLANEFEGISLVHEAYSRACYLGGLEWAIARVSQLRGLAVGLESLLP